VLSRLKCVANPILASTSPHTSTLVKALRNAFVIAWGRQQENPFPNPCSALLLREAMCTIESPYGNGAQQDVHEALLRLLEMTSLTDNECCSLYVETTATCTTCNHSSSLHMVRFIHILLYLLHFSGRLYAELPNFEPLHSLLMLSTRSTSSFTPCF